MAPTMLFGVKEGALPRNMGERKLKARSIIVLIAVSFSIVLLTSSTGFFFASGISITMVNHYPVNGETYAFVDHFLEQTTAVNTNTTVSISIDSGLLIPMTYQGIRNEIVPDDTTARDWHTWNLTISAMTEPGAHTFQFFRRYYVWQETDQYWAEFNSHSTVMSFNIAESSATPSPSPTSTPMISPTPTSTPTEPVTPSPAPTAIATPSPLPETINPVFTFTIIIASAITAFLVLTIFVLRKNNQKTEKKI